MKLLIIHKCRYPTEIGKSDINGYLKYFEKYNDGINDLYCLDRYGKRIFGDRVRIKNDILEDFVFSLKASWFIFKNIKKYNTVYYINPIFFGIFPIIISRLLGKKIIFDLRTGPVREKDLIYKIKIFLDSIIIWISNKVVFINKDIYYKLGYWGLGKKQILQTLLGYEPNDNYTEEKKLCLCNLIEDKNYKFLYVGNLGKKRELEYMIQGFNDFPNTSLYILGDGDNINYLKNIAQKNIYFLGSVPYEEVIGYMKYCDYGVSFIPEKGFYDLQPPLKTIEYLGAGLPVLGTNTQGNMKFINKKNGVIIQKYKSSESIRNAIEKIIKTPFDKGEIKLLAKRYTRENIVSKIYDFIKVR